MTIKLTFGDFSLGLNPEHGGSVGDFRLGERHLLRPSPTRVLSDWQATDFAAFPMVPFSGRIASGAFSVDGKSIKLPANMAPEPHAIHGFGWQTSWKTVEQTANKALIVHEISDHAWPWPYQAEQAFELSEHGLTLEMRLTNNGNTPMPAGLGWHPYFPRKGATISAPTQQVWLNGDDMIPAPPVPVPDAMDLTLPQEVEALELDNAFDVSAPIQTLTWPDLTLRMISDPLFSKLVVYVPPHQTYFCAEPASHAPNAHNSKLSDEKTGLRWLEPGETLSGTITLLVETTA
ncbi:MAG: aldose 1-epimerase [Henriciella sp.]